MTYTSELRNFDRELHASEALTTGGLSPASLVGAYVDWAIHLVNQPGRRLALAQEAWEDGFTMWKGFLGISHEKPCAPKSGDHRFDYIDLVIHCFARLRDSISHLTFFQYRSVESFRHPFGPPFHVRASSSIVGSRPILAAVA